ncbi:[Fe-Fe] hydrogenase large subunit C-terminal domain-containing protein [Cellulosilyticum sp. I15G10I2]|uniref:[Fe-Fe] hydrogenase large subunit C-terminal domain-containing protein n=1 Tax=Cellulosilyticum sp. I15G10I2 TaxID=1892843 RepID=UPI00085C4FA4|nr:[Fe-Fe] hydrogenase large subunit C-terminal domain-containing protein [Cellulosilyticum sp. I15G10I2]
MENKYIHFSEKRMYIFSELVKRYWNGNLNSIADLDALADDIKEKYSFTQKEMPFIKNHIRMAMGQNPKGDEAFKDELDRVKNFKTIEKPIVNKLEGPCEYCESPGCQCVSLGKYETEAYSRSDLPEIKSDECMECGYCTVKCDLGGVADKIEFLPIIDLLKDEKTSVYAVAAPAIVGQFGENVSMGKLRTALKMMGFEDLIEVSLFADILTIKEAFEFNHMVKNEMDFLLTSCCCPIWFNMIKKNYPDIYTHLSPSVSPMIASGRILKKLYQDAKVVFIAPCIAKKAEAMEQGLKGAVDYVLNFRELKEIFGVLEIDLEALQGYEKDQASLGGRLYARMGGVSFSVKTVVNRLEPKRVIKLKAKKVSGIKACRALLESIRAHEKMDSNFIEGMGCEGGCIGGPKTNIDKVKAISAVNEFGEDSLILTPFDNLNVMKILKQLGLNSIEEITHNEALEKILSR